ncbi:MAG TPA: hypothetical protein EYN69_08915 [Flavobacteriales bacterium]|nr:hypothetical protein [Flavobacteriales bacterium]
MNKEELEQKIKSLLAKMADHSNITKQLEMKSLSEDVRELQESIVILNHLNSTEIAEATTIEEPREDVVEEAETAREEPLMEQDHLVGTVQEEQEQAVQTNENDLAHEDIQEQLEPEVETRTDSVTIENPEPAPASEPEPESEQSINDQIESQSDGKSVASQLESQPIDNLIEAIGINERFLFTKELFNDDSQAYAVAIEKLNEFQSLDEARSYINSDLKSTYVWDDESEAVSSLTNLVEKRYSS